jgi:phospholipase D1/2
VHIYVLLYFEVNLALKLNSQATERKLANLHPNIHIIRHPRLRPFSWSHHQKIGSFPCLTHFDLRSGQLDCVVPL